MNTNIRIYRVTRHEFVEDELGFSVIKVYGSPHTKGSTNISNDTREIIPLSLFPTLPLGSKATTIPPVGQLLIGYDSGYPRVIYSLGYITDVITKLPLSQKPHEENEFKMLFAGLNPTSFSIKPETIKFSVGIGVDLGLDYSMKKISVASDNYERIFAGGSIYNKRYSDAATSATEVTENVEVYTKYREQFKNTDRYLKTEDHVLTNVFSDYVDKVIIRKGGIFVPNPSSGSAPKMVAADHVYQIEVLQSAFADTVVAHKDTVTTFKLGKIVNTDSTRVGAIIDWSYKTVNPTSFTYDNMVSLRGPMADGNIYVEQHRINFKNPSNGLTDYLSKGNGYDIVTDLATYEDSIKGAFWWIKNINTGVGNYFMQESLGTALNFVDFKEISDTSFFLHKNTKYKNEAGQEQDQIYTHELKKDYYNVDLSYGDDTKYLFRFKENTLNLSMQVKEDNCVMEFTDKSLSIKMKVADDNYMVEFKEGKIDINLNTGDAANSPRIRLSKDKGIEITPGTGDKDTSIVIASNDGSKHRLVTENWITKVFNVHVHPTAAQGPPSKPVEIPVFADASANSQLTFITQVQ